MTILKLLQKASPVCLKKKKKFAAKALSPQLYIPFCKQFFFFLEALWLLEVLSLLIVSFQTKKTWNQTRSQSYPFKFLLGQGQSVTQDFCCSSIQAYLFTLQNM